MTIIPDNIESKSSFFKKTRAKTARIIKSPFLVFPKSRDDVKNNAIVKVKINIPIRIIDDGGIAKNIRVLKTQHTIVITKPGK